MSDTIEHWHHDHCSGLEPILKGGANFTNLKKRILEECGYRNANDPVAHLLYDCLIALSDSPSVNPEIYEWCTDCKEYDQEAHCCHRWSKMIRKTVEEIRGTTAIGEWVKVHGFVTPGGDPVWKCSNCGKGVHVYGIEHGTYGADIADNQWVACPNCGAVMIGECDG